MKRQEVSRPGWRAVTVTTLITFCLLVAMNALPALQRGAELAPALRELVSSREFWSRQILPIAILYLLMLTVFPYAHRWLINSGSSGRPSWHRNRWLVTFGGLVYILGTAVPVGRNLLAGREYQPELLLFIALTWLVYGWLVLALWLKHPSPEWQHGFETGDHRRSLDERYYTVLGKSAVTTLYWSLGLLLVLGSLYDLLVTRSWPVRSLAEALGIFALWNAIYARQDRQL